MKQRRQITINGFGLIMVACLIFFLATSLTGQGTADTLTRQEYMEAVDVPQVTELAYELRKAGMDLPEGILSQEEFMEYILPIFARKFPGQVKL